MLRNCGGAQACLVAFDLLSLDGEDFRQRPLEERRDRLARLIVAADAISFSEALSAEGAVVFAHGCKLGLEGVVSKTGRQLLSEREEPQLAENEEPEFRQSVTYASRRDYPGRRSGAGSLIAASASAVSAITALAFAMPLAASSRK
jgi:hypothetical protein